jgi:hypothetical protein
MILLLSLLSSLAFAKYTPAATSGGGGAVDSVNGYTGVVSLVTDDIAESVAPSNLWFTDARARNACVSDTAYDATSWNGVTSIAPSKNAVRDQVEAMLSSIAGKEPAITAGSSAQYWRGDKSFQTLDTSVVPENGNQYFTTARAKTAAVSDTAYDATSWNSVTDVAASKNAVRDKIEALPSETQLLTNKKVDSSTFEIVDSSEYPAGGYSRMTFVFPPGHTGVTEMTVPSGSFTPMGADETATLRNKSIETDSGKFISDFSGHELYFDLSLGGSGVFTYIIPTSSATRSIMLPDKSGTALVGITQVEIDFGSTPITEKSFTITDATITTSSKMNVTQARTTATGKTYIDESDMDVLSPNCSPNSGSMTCLVRCLTGQVRGAFKLNYTGT